MNVSDVQRLLAAAGFYAGGIDGDEGPKTRAAIDQALDGLKRNWSRQRRRIAAAQVILTAAGFQPGVIDGYAGHNTREAFAAWSYKSIHGKREKIERVSQTGYAVEASSLPRQRNVGSFYGRPGAQIKARLVTVDLPYALRLDYNLRQSVSRVTLHQKCAPSFVAALVEVRDEYGAERMRSLGIDRYAGGYNHRQMRGGTKWSMHAYGCAVDFYAAPNGLRARCPQALFCGPDYKAFLDIMERHGWLPALRLWGADAMHFQQARL